MGTAKCRELEPQSPLQNIQNVPKPWNFERIWCLNLAYMALCADTLDNFF